MRKLPAMSIAVALLLVTATASAVDNEPFWYAINLTKGICDIVEYKVVDQARPRLQKNGWKQTMPSFSDWSLTFSGQTEGMPSAILLFETRSGCIEALRALKHALAG